MIFFFFCLLAWLTIVSFSIIPRKLPLTDNLVVFFCIYIFVRSVFTILGLNMERIVTSKNLELHFALVISRLFIFPLLLLIFVNIFFMCKSSVKRWGTALLVLVLMNFVHWLSLKLNLLSYKNWNSFYSLLMFLVYMVVAYGLEKGFQSITENEGRT